MPKIIFCEPAGMCDFNYGFSNRFKYNHLELIYACSRLKEGNILVNLNVYIHPCLSVFSFIFIHIHLLFLPSCLELLLHFQDDINKFYFR